MPYAQAVTMIHELPPMVQQPNQFSSQFSNPYAQPVQNYPSKPFSENPYYEEVIKEHPGIQSKIRQLDTNPYGKYEETMSPVRSEPPAQIGWNNIPDYPINSSPPGSVQQNYLPSSMNARVQAQHLPVAPHIPTQYERPLSDASMSSYPVVENFLSCRDVMAHVNSCPICSSLYHKNDKIYAGVISILILLIFFMVFRFSKKN
jgi:hypothetical protein